MRGLSTLGSEYALSAKAARLAGGVLTERSNLDDAIDAVSDHWRIDRMPVVDRAILRVALYELEHETDTPTAVIINEAVRIAKAFSTEKSGKFINGVLSTLAAKTR